MKYVVIYYILSSLIYIGIGSGSTYWAAFNMISILGCFFVFLINPKPKTKEFNVWIDFAAYLTIGRVLLTLPASFAPYGWVTNFNLIFTVFYVAWLIIHLTRNKKHLFNGGQRVH